MGKTLITNLFEFFVDDSIHIDCSFPCWTFGIGLVKFINSLFAVRHWCVLTEIILIRYYTTSIIIVVIIGRVVDLSCHLDDRLHWIIILEPVGDTGVRHKMEDRPNSMCQHSCHTDVLVWYYNLLGFRAYR